jgi:hypothetical protein
MGTDIIRPACPLLLSRPAHSAPAGPTPPALAGALPNILDFDGQSALHKALEAQDPEMVELLLEHGADPNQPNKDITSCCHQAAHQGAAKLLQQLLAKGADANVVNEDGWAPLHLAARAGKGEGMPWALAAARAEMVALARWPSRWQIRHQALPSFVCTCDELSLRRAGQGRQGASA